MVSFFLCGGVYIKQNIVMPADNFNVANAQRAANQARVAANTAVYAANSVRDVITEADDCVDYTSRKTCENTNRCRWDVDFENCALARHASVQQPAYIRR